jgi:hypothetical protein
MPQRVKSPDFYFFTPEKKNFFASFPIVFCGTLQEKVSSLGFTSPATPWFAVDSDFQSARCSPPAMTPSADPE